MITIHPFDRPPGIRRQYVVGRGIFMAGAYSMLALVLVWFFSMLLAGGQIGPTDNIKWDAILPWPAVWIPAWLVIAVCLLPLIGVLVLVPKARWQEAVELFVMITMTAIMFVMLPIGLARMYPDAAGAVFDDRYPEFGLGFHWLGALPQIITLAVLGIRFAMLTPAYNAAFRKSRENLP